MSKNKKETTKKQVESLRDFVVQSVSNHVETIDERLLMLQARVDFLESMIVQNKYYLRNSSFVSVCRMCGLLGGCTTDLAECESCGVEICLKSACSKKEDGVRICTICTRNKDCLVE